MTRPGDAPFRRLRSHGGTWIGLLAGLALAGAAAAEQAWQPNSAALTAQIDASGTAMAAAGSGSTIVPATATQAVPLLTARSDAALLPPSAQQHRQVMMLLLMNSAGPLGPYGRLGH